MPRFPGFVGPSYQSQSPIADHRFNVPAGCHWRDVRETPGQCRQPFGRLAFHLGGAPAVFHADGAAADGGGARRSSRNSDAGLTPLTSSWSRARVQAT